MIINVLDALIPVQRDNWYRGEHREVIRNPVPSQRFRIRFDFLGDQIRVDCVIGWPGEKVIKGTEIAIMFFFTVSFLYSLTQNTRTVTQVGDR